MEWLNDGTLMEPRYLWLIAAAALLALEAMGMSGIGLMFAGIAAFLLGVLLEFEVLQTQDYTLQLAVWFGLTVLFAAVLYRPLKRWRTDPSSKDKFENMVGDTARVAAGGLMLGKPGKVYWSGTLMNAQVAADSAKEAFVEGDTVTIAAVRGNQLIVTAPAPPPENDLPDITI